MSAPPAVPPLPVPRQDDVPFLLLRRPGAPDRCWPLLADRVTVGRGLSCDVVLEDPLVSRLHLTLERVAGVWTAVDDGLSRNGSYLAGRRLTGRLALQDRDQLRLGGTLLVFCAPGQAVAERTLAGEPLRAAARVTPAQRAVLVALARPVTGPYAAPASNAEIAEELYLSVEAVKTHLRALYRTFGLEHLPQNHKRVRLVQQAQASGLLREPVR